MLSEDLLTYIFIGVFLPWAGWVTTRISGSLSRKEHASICEANNSAMRGDIMMLITRLDRLASNTEILLQEVAALNEFKNSREFRVVRRKNNK